MHKHKVARGAAIMAIFQVASRMLDLAAMLVLARLLVPADFGLVAIATAVLLVLTALTELPVIDVLVQRDSVKDRDVNAAFTTNIIRGFSVAALMVALSFPVASIYGDPRLMPIICVLGLVPLGKNLESPALVHALREVNYRPTANILLFGKFLGAVIAIALAVATRSYWSLVAGVTITALASAAWSYVLAPYRPRLEFHGVGKLLTFAGWVTLSRIFFTMNQQGDRFFIGHIIGPAKLGNYTLGGDISSVATNSLAAPILRPMFAGMARIHSDVVRLRAAYLKSQQALAMLVLPLGVGLATVADLLVPLVLGPEWTDTRIVIWWIAPVVALQMLSVPVQAASMARGLPETLALREGIALILRLPPTLYAAYHYGFEGAVIARSVTGVIIILFNMGLADRLVGASIPAQFAAVWRSLASAAVMTLAVLMVKARLDVPTETIMRATDLVALVTLGALSYGVTHLGLWWLSGRPQGSETFFLDMARNRGRAVTA